MNQPHPPSSIPQQTTDLQQLEQGCSHQPPRTVFNTSLSTPSSSSLSTVAFDYSSCYSSNAKKRRRRHNVHFASTSDLLIIPSKSSQDKQSSWYTEQDFTNFKSDSRSFSKAMAKSSCVDTLESIAYSLATKTATPLHHVHPHPHEKILARGIEHIVSPTVQKLLAHRRKVIIRKVLCKQTSLRQQLSGMDKKELEWRMTEEMSQCSMAGSEFAKDWAMLKLLHH